MATLNRQLYATTGPEKYATFYFAMYEEATHALTYTNAGHLAPTGPGLAPGKGDRERRAIRRR